FEEIVNGYHRRSASDAVDGESADLRRTRQPAFGKFRLMGFPTIRREDCTDTNLNRFLKDEYALGADVRPAFAEAAGGEVTLPAAATIPGLDAYRVVLVNGVWNGGITGGRLPRGLEIMRVADAVLDPSLVG